MTIIIACTYYSTMTHNNHTCRLSLPYWVTDCLDPFRKYLTGKDYDLFGGESLKIFWWSSIFSSLLFVSFTSEEYLWSFCLNFLTSVWSATLKTLPDPWLLCLQETFFYLLFQEMNCAMTVFFCVLNVNSFSLLQSLQLS